MMWKNDPLVLTLKMDGMGPGMVVHSYNPSYKRNVGLRFAQAKM
jgi:hypothetical protein